MAQRWLREHIEDTLIHDGKYLKKQMPAILIGVGGNDLEIPCMLLRDFDSGIKFLEELSGLVLEVSERNGRLYTHIPLCDRTIVDKDENGEFIAEYFQVLGKENKPAGNKIPTDKVFKKYYGGCGAAYYLVLKELKENDYGVPLVGWDLD